MTIDLYMIAGRTMHLCDSFNDLSAFSNGTSVFFHLKLTEMGCFVDRHGYVINLRPTSPRKFYNTYPIEADDEIIILIHDLIDLYDNGPLGWNVKCEDFTVVKNITRNQLLVENISEMVSYYQTLRGV